MAKKKVLMLYTGGTIGMLPSDENDPASVLAPAKWEQVKAFSPALNRLPFDIETREMEVIDSSDMTPGYWLNIARNIEKNYDEYSGFVILHGTDTMAYTATALSFLLENLGKPVIVTGSQRPIVEARNDAAQNLVTALMFAASDGVPTVPEVCILFSHVLLRGNRARKVSSVGFAAFDSPNCRPLATIGESISVDMDAVRKAANVKETAKKSLIVDGRFDDNVIMLDIFPGIRPDVLRQVFLIEGLRGVVLRTFGAGNAPVAYEFLREIDYAVNQRDLVVVNVTQCNQGLVEMGSYNANKQLLRLGVVNGLDLTPEAALIKQMFLLGRYDDAATVREEMKKDYCGELS